MLIQEHLPLNRASHINQWARDLPEKFEADQRDTTDVPLEAKPEWRCEIDHAYHLSSMIVNGRLQGLAKTVH